MKYIIEVEDEHIDGLYRAKGFETLVFNEAGLKKLEPVSGALQHGYDDGYHDGLNDAWECAKEIAQSRTDDEWEDFYVYLGVEKYQPWRIFEKYSASEAIAKVQAYEEQKKADAELKVGDEIEIRAESSIPKMVVTQIDNQYISTVDAKGDTRCICKNTTTFVKTGRHFSQIEEMLKQMKGE